MYTDREEFEGWMERIMERFDRTEIGRASCRERVSSPV
mgnify:CR=1 FL=1